MNDSWKTSSYCTSAANCVEVSAPWRTSTFSGETSMCVEVAPGPLQVKVRDTKDRDRGHFAVGGSAWRAFLASVSQ